MQTWFVYILIGASVFYLLVLFICSLKKNSQRHCSGCGKD